MSVSSRHRPSSVPSTVSLNNNNASSRSSRRPPPPLAKVVTAPPWARDEPPSPKEQPNTESEHPQSQASDNYSLNPHDEKSRWWAFARSGSPRALDRYFEHHRLPSSPRAERRGFRDRSISWLQNSASNKDGIANKGKDPEKDGDINALRVSIPTPLHPSSFTAAHAATPGWDLPWSSDLAAQGPNPHYSQDSDPEQEEPNDSRETGWAARRKRLRSFILTNTYVPLLFRFINISFTTVALGMAIHIRQIELKHHTMGAVGSSPTVVIIFAPLTLVHVMAAIYLEYFGRPLGLWRTSAKLAHTLSEVLFICAWSAALSLCFDNFFTSLIPCASPSSTKWYNELPRPESSIPYDASLGDEVCDSQLALIGVVGVGLIAYCGNLIISLYRIFEKVKYHPPTMLTR